MRICSVICFLVAASALTAGAKEVAYIYGDVAADGTVTVLKEKLALLEFA